MRRSIAFRVVGVTLLVCAALTMGSHYDAAWEDHANYRTSVGSIAADEDAYVDRPVYLWLTVDSAADGRIVARAGTSPPRVTVIAPGEDPSPGDVIQVYGVFRDGYRVDASRIVVHDRENRSRMLIVSAAGALLAAAAFLRRWRFDVRRLALVPRRDEPATASAEASAQATGGSENDAGDPSDREANDG